MKSLLITNDFPPMSGGEAAWYGRVCAAIPPAEVVVLAPQVRGDRAFDARQRYPVVRTWAPTAAHPAARVTQMLLLFGRAARLARRQSIDAVHLGHLYLAPLGPILKRLFGIPYLIYLHGGEMAPYMRVPAVRSVVRGLVRHAALVVANSTYTLQYYGALGIRHPRTEIVTFGADLERFSPTLDGRPIRARYGLDGAKVVLTVGRLIERKGHDMVIRALGRIPKAAGPVRYLICGSGPEEARLRRLARDTGCQNQVVFAGQVPDDDLPLLYAACDVFAMPSRALARRDGVEGFGIVFLEAGACGKPVVGGRSGGVADAVVDGVTGILVDPLDIDDLAGALTYLLCDRDAASRLGTQGRLRAEALGSAWAEALARVWERPLHGD